MGWLYEDFQPRLKYNSLEKQENEEYIYIYIYYT